MRCDRVTRICRISAVVVAMFAVACGGDPDKRKLEHLADADAYMAQDQYAEAIIEYRNAI